MVEDATGLPRGVFTLERYTRSTKYKPDATALRRGGSRSQLNSKDRDSSRACAGDNEEE
jgi:hypothetical protein